MMYGSDEFLPISVKSAFVQNPYLGVCVVFKNTVYKKWMCSQFKESSFSIQRLNEIIYSGKYSDFEHDYVIIDSEGNVCGTNCNAKVFVDEHGYVHVEKFIIKVINDDTNPQYVGGYSIFRINETVRSLIASNTIKRPKDFKNRGFILEPVLNSNQPTK